MVTWPMVPGGGSQPSGSTCSVLVLLQNNLMYNNKIYVVVAMLVSMVILLHKVRFGKQQKGKKKYKIFPGRAALEIAIVGHLHTTHSGGGGGGLGRLICSAIQRLLLRGRQRRGDVGDGAGAGSIYGLTSTHQVLVNFPPPDMDKIMSLAHHALTAEPVQYTLFTRVFGATDSPELKTKLEGSWKSLLAPVERMFLNDTSVTAALE
ncbi:uncharacterized protein PV06_10874 [Exophiala oligosperma]|uniref:Uncharacterized protein n=1 Tax=Exophiala oligosperma TaxID=215243 RepID=A0A0D2A9H5_9EURO|nr:uncharacterized protein PV06_10874 [Exophiala oligosperma]KIW36976.1 hypothetical protein PV06_10874 [Exophiala oligosperma]